MRALVPVGSVCVCVYIPEFLRRVAQVTLRETELKNREGRGVGWWG